MKKLLLLLTLITASSAVNASNIKIQDVKHAKSGFGTYDAFSISYTPEKWTQLRAYIEPSDNALILITTSGTPRFNITAKILSNQSFPALSQGMLTGYQERIGRTYGYDLSTAKEKEFLDLQITFGNEKFYVRLKIQNRKIVKALEITEEQVGQLGEEEYDSADSELSQDKDYDNSGTNSDDENVDSVSILSEAEIS